MMDLLGLETKLVIINQILILQVFQQIGCVFSQSSDKMGGIEIGLLATEVESPNLKMG